MNDWPIDVEIKQSSGTPFNEPMAQLTITVHMSLELLDRAIQRADTENDLVSFIEEAVRKKLNEEYG